MRWWENREILSKILVCIKFCGSRYGESLRAEPSQYRILVGASCVVILHLTRKDVWHVSIGHDRFSIGHDRFSIGHDRYCIMYTPTSSSCAEWPFSIRWNFTLEKCCWITQLSIIHSQNYLSHYVLTYFVESFSCSVRASLHDHPSYLCCPDALSLVGDPLSGNGCGSPNHI